MNSRIASIAKPVFLLMSAGLLTHCAPAGSASGNSAASTAAVNNSTSAVSAAAKNMKIQMTSVASSSIKSLVLNIARVDAVVIANNQTAVVNLASNIGSVDMMSIQNGLSSTLADINLPTGVSIQQIDVVLAASGNTATSSNGTACTLTVPGSLGNILPLAFGSGLTVADSSAYSLLMAMDLRSAVTSAGNGNCLFSPTLGLSAAYKLPASAATAIASGKMAVKAVSSSQVVAVGEDILAVVMPVLIDSTGAGSIISVVSAVLEDITGTTTAGAAVSTLFGDIFGTSSKVATVASDLSVPINIATGQYLTGSGVGTMISSLVGGQSSSNTSIISTLVGDLTGKPASSSTTASSSASSSFLSTVLGALDSPLTLDILKTLI